MSDRKDQSKKAYQAFLQIEKSNPEVMEIIIAGLKKNATQRRRKRAR